MCKRDGCKAGIFVSSWIMVFLFLVPTRAHSWIRTYGGEQFGEVGRSVQQVNDGGYIVIGDLYNIDTDSRDLWLIKTDANGDTLWTHTYDAGGHDLGRCIQKTDDGGYIIIGFANVDYEWYVGDIWLLKTDALGDTLWTRLYRGSCFFPSFSRGCWVEQTLDGGYILTSNWDLAYLLLLKTDKDGNTLWSHNYQWGSQNWETGHCVRQISDGGYVVSTNMGLYKTDANGDSLWLKQWVSHYLTLTNDNGYLLLSGRDGDIWLLKTDEEGDTVWTRTYGGEEGDVAWSAQQTTDGGYVIAGQTSSFGFDRSKAWLLKTDSAGDTLWTRIFGGERSDWAYSLQQTSDSGYIIAGYTFSFGLGNGDVWLIKTDSLGYAGVAEPEPPVTPVTHPDWRVTVPVGRQITLQYENRPQGFRAQVYDAAGCKVGEISSTSPSGSISWGRGVSSGVYFVKPIGEVGVGRVVIIH